MGNHLATDKPRVASYISEALYQKVKVFQEENGYSQSEAIERIIERFFAEDYIKVDSNLLSRLKELAASEYRQPEDQLRLILERNLP